MEAWLQPLYDAYSFRVLPWLGGRVAGDEASYRYLAESIRMHPDPARLCAMMREAGLERCRYSSLSAGIVAMHRFRRVKAVAPGAGRGERGHDLLPHQPCLSHAGDDDAPPAVV